MDKEIANSLEYLSDNVENIIDILEDSKNSADINEGIDPESINFISNEMASFNTYLDSMDINISSINDNITGFLDSVSQDDEEVLNDTPEIDNNNKSILDIIEKIDELKSVIENINNDKEVGDTIDTSISDPLLNTDTIIDDSLLNSDILDRLKADIESSISLDLDSDSIETLKGNIDSVLSEIDNIQIGLDINQSIDDINILKEELSTLGDIGLENIDLDIISNDNIDSIISKLTELNDVDLDLNIANNIDDIIRNLDDIKNLDLSNLEDINLDSLQDSLSTIDSSLDNMTEYDLKLNIEDNTIESIDKIKADIDTLSTTINETDLSTEVNINPSITDVDSIQEDLDTQLNSIDTNVDIIPNIEDLSTDMAVNVTPNIELDDIQVSSSLNGLNSITPEENDDNVELVKYLMEGNKVLSDLTIALNNFSEIDKSTPVENADKLEKDEDKKETSSIITIDAPKQDTGIAQIVPILQQMVVSNNMILKKLTKTSFNTDLDF